MSEFKDEFVAILWIVMLLYLLVKAFVWLL